MDDDLYWAGVEFHGDDHVVVRISGELDLSCQGPLMSLVDACVEVGVRTMMLDLTRVSFCGSPCVGVLLHAGRVLPPNPDPRVRVRPSSQVLRTLEFAGVASGVAGFVIDPT